MDIILQQKKVSTVLYFINIFFKLSRLIMLTWIFFVQPLPNMIRKIRESLLLHLSAVLGNDEVAAQYLLLHLLSRVYSPCALSFS